jgi:hypothetical protein
MRSEGGTGGHARTREGTNPLQMRLFDETGDDRQ